MPRFSKESRTQNHYYYYYPCALMTILSPIRRYIEIRLLLSDVIHTSLQLSPAELVCETYNVIRLQNCCSVQKLWRQCYIIAVFKTLLVDTRARRPTEKLLIELRKRAKGCFMTVTAAETERLLRMPQRSMLRKHFRGLWWTSA